MSDDVTSLKQMLRVALQRISDLTNGVAAHVHRCPDGHEWTCTSPYCDVLNRACLEHDGGPLGRPPEYAIEPRYARETVDA